MNFFIKPPTKLSVLPIDLTSLFQKSKTNTPSQLQIDVDEMQKLSSLETLCTVIWHNPLHYPFWFNRIIQHSLLWFIFLTFWYCQFVTFNQAGTTCGLSSPANFIQHFVMNVCMLRLLKHSRQKWRKSSFLELDLWWLLKSDFAKFANCQKISPQKPKQTPGKPRPHKSVAMRLSSQRIEDRGLPQDAPACFQ